MDHASPEFQIGFWIGRSLPLVLAAAGVLWCFVILRRPNVNRKGLLALAAVLVSFIFLGIAGITKSTAAHLALGALVFACLLSSFVLAIAAIVDGGGRVKFVQGRGQAIAALVLTSLTGMAIMTVALSTVLKKAAEARKGGSRERGTGQPIELDKERFRLKTLPAPWVKLAPGKLNPLACLAVTRTQPEMYCLVIAEAIAADSPPNMELYVAAVKSNLLRADPTAKIEQEVPEAINGSEGIRMTASARVSNISIFYRYWMHGGSGRVYQVILWGPEKDRARVLTESESLFANIEILPPEE